eukprot:2850347-Rhodomonas_salina.3
MAFENLQRAAEGAKEPTASLAVGARQGGDVARVHPVRLSHQDKVLSCVGCNSRVIRMVLSSPEMQHQGRCRLAGTEHACPVVAPLSHTRVPGGA